MNGTTHDMPRLFAFALFFALSAGALWGEGLVRFFVEPHAGYTRGAITEFLYDGGSDGRLLSKLEWDRNLFLYGVNASLSVWRFSLGVDFSASVPGECGNMQDSDWMSESRPQMKTTYSVGTNEAVQNYDTTLSLSFDFFPFCSAEEPSFVLSPAVQLQYQYDSFDRSSAEGWYGQWQWSDDGANHWWYEDEAAHFPYSYWSDEKGRYVTRKLAGVSYSRHALGVYLGVGARIRIFRRLWIEPSFFAAPFSYAKATDTHHGSETRYGEKQKWHWKQLRASLGAEYALTERISATLGAAVLCSQAERGTYARDGIKDSSYRTGAGQFSFTARAGVRVRSGR